MNSLLVHLKKWLLNRLFNSAFVLLAFGAGAVISTFTNDRWYSWGLILLFGRYILPQLLSMMWKILLFWIGRFCLIILFLAILGILFR